jgi:hypothetical protein
MMIFASIMALLRGEKQERPKGGLDHQTQALLCYSPLESGQNVGGRNKRFCSSRRIEDSRLLEEQAKKWIDEKIIATVSIFDTASG